MGFHTNNEEVGKVNKEVMIVTGAGQISMAIARRLGYGKKLLLVIKILIMLIGLQKDNE